MMKTKIPTTLSHGYNINELIEQDLACGDNLFKILDHYQVPEQTRPQVIANYLKYEKKENCENEPIDRQGYTKAQLKQLKQWGMEIGPDPVKQKKYEQLYRNFYKAFSVMYKYAEKNPDDILKGFDDEDILIENIDCWYEEFGK